MAKLYFRYGAMGSSRNPHSCLMGSLWSHEERGQYAVLLKPRTDNRDGEHEIKSRIRSWRHRRNMWMRFLKEIQRPRWSNGEYRYHGKKVDAVLIDEAQFLSPGRKLSKHGHQWIFMGFRFSATVCVRTSRHICFRVRED